ncbi:MAG: hypothetical protein NC412_00790 [Roseburia sp.]|nr:hypothetical protein [Roseburia sp.]MCM1277868.1 hypothetical protein [Robinsoniella sp.]
MRNTKKIAGRLLLILLVLFLFETVVEFVYRPYNRYSLYAIRDLKQCQGKIDTLFLGTSTAYRGFSPDIFDKELGTFSYNAATASQPVDGTLALLKDQAARNPIERVIVGVSQRSLVKEEAYIERKEEVYDRLFSLKEKASYLIEGCTSEEWLNLIFYSTRIEKYFNIGHIKKNLTYKLSGAYKENKAPMKTYGGRGFLAEDTVYQGKTYETITKMESTWKADDDNEKALIEIMEYCRTNNIELILTLIPVTGAQINSYKDISVIHDYIQRLADEYEAIFWDFNYYIRVKEEFPNSMFKDKKHLNKAGGMYFSRLFAEIYKKYQNGEAIDGYFLDSCPYYEKSY